MSDWVSFYYFLEQNSIQCNLCARHCNLSDNEHGYCGVIVKDGKKIENLVEGRFVILKKKQKELHVGGLGSTTRLSFDPFWDLSQFPSIYSNQIGRNEVDGLLRSSGTQYSPASLVSYAKSLNCERIVFTYNDQLASLEYINEVSKIFPVKIVTNGFFSKESFEILPNDLDIYLYSTFDKFYSKHCKIRLVTVKENIKQLSKRGKKIRILCPLIDGENDSDASILNLAKFLKGIDSNIPLRFMKFIPDFKVVDKPITTEKRLEEAIALAREYGLKDVDSLIDNLG